MVNYARMETVWRSYGPLEPIGPYATKPRKRSRRAMAAGLAAVCVAGAGAGLYLRPNLDGQAQAASASSPEPQALMRVSAPAGSSGDVARLDSQLQLLVMQGGTSTSAPSAPLAGETSFVAPPAGERPAPSAPTRVRTEISIPRAETPPAARRPARAPMVLASRTPTPTALPRSAPRAAPEPSVADVAAPTPAPPAPASNFNCDGARTAADRLICASPELASLDRNMAAELEAAVAAGHSARELARDQANWRRRREKAAPDPRAVADLYRQRIGQLRSMQ